MRDILINYDYTLSRFSINNYDDEAIAYCRLGCAVLNRLYKDYHKDIVDELYVKNCLRDSIWLELLGVNEEYLYEKFVIYKMVDVMNKVLERK